MRPHRILSALALVAACTGAPKPDATMEQGRLYTGWLLGGQLDQLYQRFSPEMRRTFPSVAELSAFVTRTTNDLGAEQGTPTERVSVLGTTKVYSRTARFAGAPRPVEVQFTVDTAGRVTGLLVHLMTADSAAAPADTTRR
jgi:hypothetical protein